MPTRETIDRVRTITQEEVRQMMEPQTGTVTTTTHPNEPYRVIETAELRPFTLRDTLNFEPAREPDPGWGQPRPQDDGPPDIREMDQVEDECTMESVPLGYIWKAPCRFDLVTAIDLRIEQVDWMLATRDMNEQNWPKLHHLRILDISPLCHYARQKARRSRANIFSMNARCLHCPYTTMFGLKCDEKHEPFYNVVRMESCDSGYWDMWKEYRDKLLELKKEAILNPSRFK